jgi:hypothetical protein
MTRTDPMHDTRLGRRCGGELASFRAAPTDAWRRGRSLQAGQVQSAKQCYGALPAGDQQPCVEAGIAPLLRQLRERWSATPARRASPETLARRCCKTSRRRIPLAPRTKQTGVRDAARENAHAASPNRSRDSGTRGFPKVLSLRRLLRTVGAVSEAARVSASKSRHRAGATIWQRI